MRTQVIGQRVIQIAPQHEQEWCNGYTAGTLFTAIACKDKHVFKETEIIDAMLTQLEDINHGDVYSCAFVVAFIAGLVKGGKSAETV